MLAVKDNQPKLAEALRRHFREHPEDDFAAVRCRRHQTQETAHGRKEERSYSMLDLPEDLIQCDAWRDAQT